MVNVPERNACRVLVITNRESSSHNVFRMGISFIRKIHDYHIKDDYMQETTLVVFRRQMHINTEDYVDKMNTIIYVTQPPSL